MAKLTDSFVDFLPAWFGCDWNKVSLLVKFKFKKFCLLVKISCLPAEKTVGSGFKYNWIVGFIIGLVSTELFSVFLKKAQEFQYF